MLDIINAVCDSENYPHQWVNHPKELQAAIIAALREKLADLCHEQWVGWMQYLFSKGVFNNDGTWTMPAKFVERWRRQMETPYSALSLSEQDSDRKEADKFLALLGSNDSELERDAYPFG